MRKIIFSAFIFAGFFLTSIVSCNNADTKKENTTGTTAAISNDSLLKRGEYLIHVGGCDHCHTPKKMGPNGPEPDMDNRFAGYPADRPFGKIDSNLIKNGKIVFSGDLLAAAGPWGVSFGANISGDDTGLGTWTLDQFKKAFQEGKWKGMDGSRTLLPPMPWQDFKAMTNDDVAAIFAFLKASKPIKNIEPAPKQLSEL